MRRSAAWVAPATGIVFIALAVAAVILIGEGQDATKKTAQEIAGFYDDNEGEQTTGAFLLGGAGIFFLFFAGTLRRVLRDAEGPGGILSAVSFAGAIVFVIAVAVAASLNLALADLADDIDPVALQAINGISWDFFIPFSVGMSPFLLASGISAVLHGALPRWLGGVAIVLGIAAYTPAGFFAFIGGLAWILIVSVLLTIRGRYAPPAGATGA